METATEIHNIDTINAGEVPTLAILTEMEGNTPRPNFDRSGRIWGWEVEDDIFPADEDGLF